MGGVQIRNSNNVLEEYKTSKCSSALLWPCCGQFYATADAQLNRGSTTWLGLKVISGAVPSCFGLHVHYSSLSPRFLTGLIYQDTRRAMQ